MIVKVIIVVRQFVSAVFLHWSALQSFPVPKLGLGGETGRSGGWVCFWSCYTHSTQIMTRSTLIRRRLLTTFLLDLIITQRLKKRLLIICYDSSFVNWSFQTGRI